jgi:transposase, IS5 family
LVFRINKLLKKPPYGTKCAQSEATLICKSMTNSLFFHQNLINERFLQTDLGQLYLSIPFDKLSSTIPSPKNSISGKGCKPWFDIKAGIALQFLKHYLGLSDALSIERINTDWSMQMFCDIQLKPMEVIKDTNLPSFWQGYIGTSLDIDAKRICSSMETLLK